VHHSDQPDVLYAKDAIRELLARYCRAIDRCDAELLETIYHPDAIDDHGLPGLDKSAAAFRAAILPILHELWETTQHVLGSSAIDVRGDEATCETYVVAYHRRHPDESGVKALDVVGARYLDRIERRAGTWRIAQRTVVRDWQETRRSDDPGPRNGAIVGRRDREDGVYGLANLWLTDGEPQPPSDRSVS
jgi:SnoaL-like domain